jgi:hypothetical protein
MQNEEGASEYEAAKGFSALGLGDVEESGDYAAKRCGCPMFLLAGKPYPPCHVHGWPTKWERQ